MSEPVRIGAAGLGRAFMLMLPTFVAHPRVRLVAACDERDDARARFERDFGGRAYRTVEELCADRDVDAIYVATPHEMHARHVTIAARCGKHALVEKPMAINLAECAAMNEAARAAGVQLVVGHSHSFDLPYARTRALIAGGGHGRLRMINAMNYTDFLYRPRRPGELDTARGGGVIFSQAAHQVDVVRLLAGGRARSVRVWSGAWDAARPTEGAYAAQMLFDDGTFASLVYSGYAHFDSDELMEGIGEMGLRKDLSRYGLTRARPAARECDEVALKNRRAYGACDMTESERPVAHNHFGIVIASCERADLRPLPDRIVIYDDERVRTEKLPPPQVPRGEVIDELCDAIAGVRPPVHSGEWAMATLEACLGILASSRSGSEVALEHQVGLPE